MHLFHWLVKKNKIYEQDSLKNKNINFFRNFSDFMFCLAIKAPILFQEQNALFLNVYLFSPLDFVEMANETD